MIRAPGLVFKIPWLKIPCGDIPLAVCDDSAKAPPTSFVDEVADNPAAVEILVAIDTQLENHG